MACLFRLRVNQHSNQPLDLPPATEMNDVSALAADLGTRRCGCTRIVAQFGDQAGGVERRSTVGNEGMLDQGCRLSLVKPVYGRS